MIKPLYPYQKEAIDNIARKFRDGAKRVLFQLATGGGKTITASALIHRFMSVNEGKEIVFLVHREELLKQFKRTFESQYGIEVGTIVAGQKLKRIDLSVHVGMIETVYRRLQKNHSWLGKNIGMIIVDECHIGSFDKIFEFLPDILTVGLTATPHRLTKKHPLNSIYDEIVTSITIEELIERGALSPNKSWQIKNQVNFSSLKQTGGDFNSGSVFEEYSKEKHIRNVVTAYEKIAHGKKTLIFNSTIEHSELVNNIFNLHGYPSRHLDGATNKEEREEIIKWFSKTPEAILQNVGVLTAGFDEPSIECIIMNRPTTSLSLWLQCTGRGSRVSIGKSHFDIIDLGGNISRLGDWCFSHDWENIFRSAKIDTSEKGIAPVKDCPKCYYMMPIQCHSCPECGYIFSQKEIQESTASIELELITDNLKKKVNIYKVNNFVEKMGFNDYAGLHMVKDAFLRVLNEQGITEESVIFSPDIYGAYSNLVEKWCEENDKKYNKWHKDYAEKILREKITEAVA